MIHAPTLCIFIMHKQLDELSQKRSTKRREGVRKKKECKELFLFEKLSLAKSAIVLLLNKREVGTWEVTSSLRLPYSLGRKDAIL